MWLSIIGALILKGRCSSLFKVAYLGPTLVEIVSDFQQEQSCSRLRAFPNERQPLQASVRSRAGDSTFLL